MGKWLARLVALDDAGEGEKSSPTLPPHCQNRQNPLLSVLAVAPEWAASEISGEHQAAAELPHPLGRGWSDADITRFHARRARLLRWGWPSDVAEVLADRLTCRDVAGDDDRVSCGDCRHYRPGRCGNHRHAGLHSAYLGLDLAGMLQRCPGFQLEG